MSRAAARAAVRRDGGGFTLVELMATLAIAGVLIVGAVPSFTGIILSQGVKGTAVDLVEALTFTRSEAIKRNRRITLRPQSDDWRQPWFLCSAPSPAEPTLVQGRCADGEVELSLRDWTPAGAVSISAVTPVTVLVRAPSGTTTTTTTTPVTAVTFRSDGRTSALVQFTLCTAEPTTAVNQRLIRLDASGRPNLRQGGPCAS